MSRISDTMVIIRDSGERQVTVLSATVINSSGRSWRSGTTAVWTGTCAIFPIRGTFDRAANGEVMQGSHTVFFPLSSTVSVGQQILETGETDYYETKFVKLYEDHKEIICQLVGGR